MLPPNIRQSADLVTSHAAIREGFLKQALAKTRKADPYIDEALVLQAALADVDDIQALPKISVTSIREALLAAAGFSNKARGHLSEIELQGALAQVLETIKQRSGESWRGEIVFRFLLTRGDTLGGSMRNLVGSLSGIQLTEAIVGALAKRNIMPDETHRTKTGKVSSLRWGNRLLRFDTKLRIIDKNVDAVLIDVTKSAATGPVTYELADIIACGELKGGIDPGGADEHWKTTGSALERIRALFPVNQPAIFFVGAAIATAMAREIFEDLESGRLTYAANLTVPQQVADLGDWLVAL